MKKWIIVFLLMTSNLLASDPHARPYKGKWKVVRVENTMLEIGVLKPAITNFNLIRKKYIGSVFIFSENSFSFPLSLKSTSSFSRSIIITNTFLLFKRSDTDDSLRFPGDELNCDSTLIKTGECYVGETFMKILGTKANKLYVTNAVSRSADKFMYKLCDWQGKYIGLYLVNSDILLILKKI